MSPCSSSWVSGGAFPRAADKLSSAAVSVPSNGMNKFSGGGAWQWTVACAFTARPQSQPALTSFSYHGGDHAAIGSKGPMEKTIRNKKTIRNVKTARPCQFIRGQGRALMPPSGRLQVLGRRLPGLAVGNDLEGHLLAFLELIEPGALDRADVDEYVLAAILRLD